MMQHLFRRALVPALILLGGVLAVGSLVTDSVTTDETVHLTAGFSYLHTGDFRLVPDHPPLGELWAALPLWLSDAKWNDSYMPGWTSSDAWQVAANWLFELNDGQRLIVIARLMVVLLYMLTLWGVYLLARTLFGRAAGLLALGIAALDPNLLAHGRLVTTDLPITLLTLLTLLAAGALLRRFTLGRLAGLVAGIAALSVSKFSWPLVIPALLAMAVAVMVRRRGWAFRLPSWWPAESVDGAIASRPRKALVLLGVMTFCAVGVWAGIWTSFNWRFSPFAPGAEPGVLWYPRFREAAPTTMEQAWKIVTSDAITGERIQGLVADFVAWARTAKLLPEAYLYGLAYTLKMTHARPAFLMGQTSKTGFWLYFPVAIAIKTPVATLALIVAGILAIVSRPSLRTRDPVLLTGVVATVLVLLAQAIIGRFNIGLRHVLPAYPLLIALAGASLAWRWTAARMAIAAGLIWLIAANILVFPNYLAYFNEFIGGPAQGYRYLSDSNIDWGQDLLRLRAYVEKHPGELLKVSYSGSAPVRFYVPNAECLPSMSAWGPPAKLCAGTYVLGCTFADGVILDRVSDSFWAQDANRQTYRQLYDVFVARHGETSGLDAASLGRAQAEFERASACLLINRLIKKPADARIGYGMLAYRLNDQQVAELIRP